MAKKIVLNGKSYRYGDTSHMNETQRAHMRGEVDVYAQIDPRLPSIAEQWREDYKKRKAGNGKSSGNR